MDRLCAVLLLSFPSISIMLIMSITLFLSQLARQSPDLAARIVKTDFFPHVLLSLQSASRCVASWLYSSYSCGLHFYYRSAFFFSFFPGMS